MALTCTLWLILALTVICFAAYSRRHEWVGWGPQAVAAVLDNAVMLGSVALAALLAWLAIPLRTSANWHRLITSTRTQAAVTRHLMAIAIVAGPIIVTIPTLLALVFTPGHPEDIWGGVGIGLILVWIVGSAAAVTALGLVGAYLGWLFRSRVALIVAPVLVYLSTTLPLYTFVIRPWSGIYAAQAIPWLTTVPTLATASARAGFWIAATAVLVGLLSGTKSFSKVAAAGASACLAAAIIVGPAGTAIPQANEILCKGADPTLCTRKIYASGARPFHQILEEGLASVPAPLRPKYVNTDPDIPIGETGTTLVLEPIGGTSSPTNLPDRNQTLVNLGRVVFATSCAENSLAATAAFFTWAAQMGIAPEEAHQPWEPSLFDVLSPADHAALTHATASLSTLNPPEFAAWLEVNAEAFTDCSLSFESMP